MTKKDEDGGLSSEVSSRLDELFGDEESEVSPKSDVQSRASSSSDATSREAKKEKKPDAALSESDDDKDSPIKNLKALVFSIDWEITDDNMISFLQETRRLQQKLKNDKILVLFLKLHESIGKYIKARKAKAHPDSIKFVASVFKNFEKALLTPGINEVQKKKLLSTEVQKFKDFKQRVLLREGAIEPEEIVVLDEAAEDRREVRTAEKAPSLAGASLGSQEALDYIVEELKKVIKSEFHTLRQIIKNLGA